jgi:hypothetical protein
MFRFYLQDNQIYFFSFIDPNFEWRSDQCKIALFGPNNGFNFELLKIVENLSFLDLLR